MLSLKLQNAAQRQDLVYVPRIQRHTSHNRREPLPNLAKMCMRSKRGATVRREETIPAAKSRLAFVEQLRRRKFRLKNLHRSRCMVKFVLKIIVQYQQCSLQFVSLLIPLLIKPSLTLCLMGLTRLSDGYLCVFLAFTEAWLTRMSVIPLKTKTVRKELSRMVR